MKQDDIQFVINPDEINNYFEDFEHKSPLIYINVLKKLVKSIK